MKVELPSNWSSVFLYLCLVVPWVIGIAVAKTAWITIVCVLLPPAAWVVTAMHFLGTNC